MTKRDGDRLRAMQTELLEMAGQYDPAGLTACDLIRLHNAIEYALRGLKFRVMRVCTRTEAVQFATKSPDLPPAA